MRFIRFYRYAGLWVICVRLCNLSLPQLTACNFSAADKMSSLAMLGCKLRCLTASPSTRLPACLVCVLLHNCIVVWVLYVLFFSSLPRHDVCLAADSLKTASYAKPLAWADLRLLSLKCIQLI